MECVEAKDAAMELLMILLFRDVVTEHYILYQLINVVRNMAVVCLDWETCCSGSDCCDPCSQSCVGGVCQNIIPNCPAADGECWACLAGQCCSGTCECQNGQCICQGGPCGAEFCGA